MEEYHIPLDDDIELEEYSKQLFKVVEKLDGLLSEGKNVFVHCLSGATRAPTVVLGYLCLYLKNQNW